MSKDYMHNKVTVLLTDAQKAELTAEAERSGYPLGAWIRHVCSAWLRADVAVINGEHQPRPKRRRPNKRNVPS